MTSTVKINASKGGSDSVIGNGTDDTAIEFPVDASISYPSYMSFDEYIDVERLRSLDGYIAERLRQRLDHQDLKFYTGPYTLAEEQAGRPGSRMVYLSASGSPDSYFDLDRTELWHPTPDAEVFAELMDFIHTLPFAATGRMLIMYDDSSAVVPPHRDHVEIDVCHEFLWFRTNFSKPFYMLNQHTDEKRYVEGHSAWFDSVNQFHGSDACEGLAFSIRVDGKFTEEFRRRIPVPAINAASTPSYWAAHK
jgi:hypothetical protein